MAAPSGARAPSGALTLLSGPDLGGGYLHQLSVSPEGDPRRFVHHAQDGGADAGGPPIGALGPLGFAHPPSSCQFGGPNCWHREYSLPLDRASHVRTAYNRLRFTLETMLAQSYAGAPIAIAAALRELVARLAAPLGAAGVEWFVAGSTAGWLQGGKLSPRDIDLGTTRVGVDRLAELLQPYLIEPAGPTEWPRVGPVRGSRAFVGTLKEGARVEWSTPVLDRPPAPFEEFGGVAGSARLVLVRFEGMEIATSRPEYGLVRAATRGRSDAEQRWGELVRRSGPDLELLDALLVRSGLPGERRTALRTSVAAR